MDNVPQVNTVAFIIAMTAFFTVQFNFKGNLALACAFTVSLCFALAPLVSAAYPTIAPALDVILKTILLTISAAGGYNVMMKVAAKVGTAQ